MTAAIGSSPGDARLAYFIMVHHKPTEFEWLMRAIYHPDDLFLVHVDLKSRLGIKRDRRGLMREVRRICAGRPNVVLMRSRFTNWGGWSLSAILLDAMNKALARDAYWTHFVNLSGQCYPLKPQAEIRRRIADAGDTVRIELRALTDAPPDDWHLGDNKMIELPLWAIRLRGRRPPPADFMITHKGSQWVIMPRAFCEWAASAPITRSIRRYMSRLLLSDELVMQALVLNGPYASRIAPHFGRAIVWPGPKVLTMADLPLLASDEMLFGRKVDLSCDASLMAALATRSEYEPGPMPAATPSRVLG